MTQKGKTPTGPTDGDRAAFEAMQQLRLQALESVVCVLEDRILSCGKIREERQASPWPLRSSLGKRGRCTRSSPAVAILS